MKLLCNFFFAMLLKTNNVCIFALRKLFKWVG
jgi:hypothetical protein